MVALLLAVSALAQTAVASNAVEEQRYATANRNRPELQATAMSDMTENQFAAFHAQLNGAADRLLTDSAQLSPAANVESREQAIAVTRGENPAKPPELSVRFSGPVFRGIGLARVKQFRPLLEPILREEGVPGDLMAVVLVESGGRPAVLSPKGALGLWQLMPETARRYGLTVTPEKDERLDALKATRAAARYLHDLYGQFSDWTLALAAYNAGEQTVQRAVALVGSNDFRRLGGLLPAETRNYVPAVEAAFRLFGGTGSAQHSASPGKAKPRVVFANVEQAN